MKKVIDRLKKHKEIIFRGSIFFLLIYVIIPSTINVLIKNNQPLLRYNFFSFPVYTLLMFLVFTIFNRDKILSYKKFPKIKSTLIYLIPTTISLLLYYYFRFIFKPTLGNAFGMAMVAWAFYGIGTFFLLIAMFGLPLLKRTCLSLFLFTFATYQFYVFTTILWELWNYFAYVISKIVFFILNIFSNTAVIDLGTKDPTLGLNGFNVVIGPPCSGIESLSLFIGLFILLVAYEWKNLNMKKTITVFFIGLIGTFFINIIRIVILIIIGTIFPEFATGQFHSNAGWILFSALILLLLYFCYGWMINKKVKR